MFEGCKVMSEDNLSERDGSEQNSRITMRIWLVPIAHQLSPMHRDERTARIGHDFIMRGIHEIMHIKVTWCVADSMW